MAALSHKFGWLRYPLCNAYIVSCIQAIYIGKMPPMEILMAAPLRELLYRLKYLQNRCITLPKSAIVVGPHRRYNLLLWESLLDPIVDPPWPLMDPSP